MVQATRGRRAVVERLSIPPGHVVVVDHLRISHKQQIKDTKRQRRQAKRAGRRAAKK
ncbi:MAG: hypothetical protein WBM50_23970 [Acidimicrobiales bacterium]